MLFGSLYEGKYVRVYDFSVGVHRDCSAHWEGRSIDFYWTADGSTDESKSALEENSQALCALPVDKALKGGNGQKGQRS